MKVPIHIALFILIVCGCVVHSKPIPVPVVIPTPTVVAPSDFVVTQTALLAERGECSARSFYSAALGEQMSFSLYLPPDYSDEPDRHYPTVYLLSGGGGNYKEWVEYGICPQMDLLLRDNQVQPMILVMPSGNDNPAVGTGSYWFNHALPPVSDGKRWGDYIWQDMVAYTDSNYRTLPQRASRAIGGLSAGGQGALTHALTHPEIFSVIGAHSPSFRHADGSIAEFGDQTYYNQYDPIWLVNNTQTWRQLTIWMDDGDSDTEWGSAIRDFHVLLTSLDIPHDWHVFSGGHEPAYWIANVPNYLKWYASELVGQ